MKKINSIITNLVLITIFAAFGCAATMAQSFGGTLVGETRPFDFSDKFYFSNGVDPNMIFNRVTGADKYSVVSKAPDENHRNVRIIATIPAYNADGSILFFNLYGELYDTSFVGDETGKIASEIAKTFPMFVFPSATVKGVNRQANLIEVTDKYFLSNPLGLSQIVEVAFTEKAQFADSSILAQMAKRNGTSLDGTPIIKTIDELNDLTRLGYVTQRIRGIDTRGPSYAIAKVLDISKPGAVAPDAFFMTETGSILDAETSFASNFDCLQKEGRLCADSLNP